MRLLGSQRRYAHTHNIADTRASQRASVCVDPTIAGPIQLPPPRRQPPRRHCTVCATASSVAAAAERRSNGVVIGAALAGAISDVRALAAIAAITQLGKVLMNILMLSFLSVPSDGTGRHNSPRRSNETRHASCSFHRLLALEEKPHHLATGIGPAWLGVRSGSTPAGPCVAGSV